MRLWTLAAMVAFVLVVVAPEASGAAGTAITTCGQLVTTNAFLTQNLHCPGGSGIVVGANRITIDLKGFRLRGDTTNDGIDADAFDGVTIRNGTIRNFGFGVGAGSSADKLTVQNVVASGNITGVAVTGSSAKIQSSDLSGNSSAGVQVFGDSATIQSVTASGNGVDGILVAGNSASVKSSIIDGNGSDGIEVSGNSAKITGLASSGNGGDGILVNGDAAQIKSNRADGNGFNSGASDLSGLGIEATGYTTAPTGKNVAQGSDDTAECSPALLC
jgi:hypothetical protein